MTNEEEVILALKELKDWEGLPYCIEEPMQNEGIAVITKEALDKAIKTLEQTRWIPCSERLPERDVNVLTYHRDVAFDYQYVSWIDDYSGKWAGFIGNLSDEVLAWMPLPEDYKEGSK